MRPMITYTLTATAVHIDSGNRDRCKRDISIMPSSAVAPPLQIEDFPYEYTSTSSKVLRRHVWTRPFGNLRVSAVEPPPLNMSTTSPRASTTASIKLLFEPCKARGSAIRPYDWTIAVKSFLRVRTFVTTQPLKQIPTPKAVKTDHLVQMDSEDTLADLRQCDTLPWRLHRLSPVGTIIADATATPWTTTLIVPVNASKTLLPTFLSPLAARRYALVLALKVDGLCHGILALEIPIQIIHDPSHGSDHSARILCRHKREGLLQQDPDGMASVTIEDGQDLDPEDRIKPPPYAQY